MVDYVKSRKTAKRLLDKNGRLVTFKSNSRRLLDDSRPWGDATGAKDTFDSKCVFVDYEYREIDGRNVKDGDKKLLLNAIDPGDNKVEDFEIVKDGDDEWRIKNIKPVKPGEIEVMYEVQIRK